MTQPAINFSPSVKQAEAWNYLFDKTTKYVGYGGSAFSGKSYLLCYWITTMCIAYPDTGYGLGRKELVTLKKTTLLTLFKVFRECGFVEKVHYNFDKQINIITFYNKSQIFLLDTAYKPSDPLFTRFGGLELTACVIDESAESPPTGIEILYTRIGRRNNDLYSIMQKLLETFNPAKNHVYSKYYSPWKLGAMPIHTRFVKALPKDNPSPEVEEYVKGILETGNKVTIERLIHGNFEYDDDPTVLCDYDSIVDCFTNEHVKGDGNKRISADLAMQGRDKFIGGSWDGLVCRIAIDKAKSTGKEIEEDLKALMIKDNVGRSQTIADSDGMGSYLVSYLDGIKEFHGNGKAINEIEFANIKAECAYKLAEFINNRKLRIICTSEQKQRIIEELAILKAESVDKDESKKRIIKKDLMKELLGRSPDYLDMLIMGMWWHCVRLSTGFIGR